MIRKQTTCVRRLLSGVIAAAGTVTSLAAIADVTIEERIAMDGFGPMKLGALDGTTTTSIAPDRARIDSQVQFKSRLLRAFSGGKGGTAQIIRLDTERMFDLDIDKKQYSETTFQAMKDGFNTALQKIDAQEGQSASTAPSGVPIDESQCDWSPAKANVSRTGARAQLAGFATEQVIISVSQTCTDRETKASCDFEYSIDQWLAADMPGGPQVQAFWLSYARKLGAEEMVSSMQMRSQQVFSRYKDGWGEAIKSAGELQGYPLKSTFTMQVGGPSCAQSAPGNTAAGEPPMLPTATDAAAQAGAQTAASSATSVAAQAAAEEAGGGVAGGVAGSAIGAFGGSLASGLMNRMRKKTPEPAPAPAAAAAPANNMMQMFRMTSETVAVRESSIPADQFEVPSGYKKAEQ